MPPVQNSHLFKSPDIFESLATDTPGLRTPYRVVNPNLANQLRLDSGLTGLTERELVPQVYLDNTASTQILPPVVAAVDAARDHYANPHSINYVSAKLTTDWYKQAHDYALRFFGANPKTHLAIFNGAGATGPLNMVAHHLLRINPDPEKTIVLFGEDAHHANMLPYRAISPNGAAIPILTDNNGKIILDHLQALLSAHQNNIALVALTGASNVTGYTTDFTEMAHMVHNAGAQLLVDAAQLAAHQAIHMAQQGIDYLVMAAHKAYAPSGPGLLIMPKKAAPSIPPIHGGGNVEGVSLDSVKYTSNIQADFYEAGTPDPLGAIALHAALKTLTAIGMDRVWEHEKELLSHLMQGLAKIPGLRIYGDTDLQKSPRVGVVAFNLDGLDHGFVSRVLSDYFAIATRNGCFCAHPLVSKLMGIDQTAFMQQVEQIASGERDKPGMVRASLGVYTSLGEVNYLLKALTYIQSHQTALLKEYKIENGQYTRLDGFDPSQGVITPFQLVFTEPDAIDLQLAADQEETTFPLSPSETIQVPVLTPLGMAAMTPTGLPSR